MTKLLLVGSKAPALVPPTVEEQEAIEKFASSKKQLDALRRRVADGMAHAVNEPKLAPEWVRTIFDDTHEALERVLVKRVDGFKQWSFGATQPRMLARAATLPSMEKFLRAGFGVSDPRFRIEGWGLSGQERSFATFFFGLFWEEANLARKCELPANIDEAAEVMWRSYGRSSQKKRSIEKWLEKKLKGKPATHACAWYDGEPDDEEDWYQYLLHIEDGGLAEFQERLESGDSISKYDGDIFVFDSMIDFLDERREYWSNGTENKVIAFIDGWKREKFFNSLEMDSAYFSYSAELADLLLYAIINDQLPVDDAVEEGSPVPKKTPGPGKLQPRSLQERLDELDAFARENPGAPVSGEMRRLFPELALIAPGPPDLPGRPPAKWPSDRIMVDESGSPMSEGGRLETPPQFIKRNYGPWLGKGLTRAHLRHLDKELWQSLYNWLRNNEMPADVDLPTKSEQVTRWVDSIDQVGATGGLERGSGPDVIRSARNLDAARRRRQTDNEA